MEEKYITSEQLEEVLSKYFKTLEEKSKEQEEQNKIIQENQSKEIEVLESQLSDEVAFRTELIEQIKQSNFNTQYSNNLFFWSIVITGTILICVLMYKFLEIFI